ncbi:hypothetical protein DLAC_10350 [Tieghemostelium lacteum]|uniref:Uncharacterized protein n=1 Tax=Tieghemostelium lacteum TaxID=361077 RepID=A0A151Z5A6_TIELA|nr:hypothetical protein DLAC_10350 [Tieghemostelium lacteum]|eukprot:KYQ89115.1 hypothetical protein DLAC_10350 [Tieghemostelium lacteum]
MPLQKRELDNGVDKNDHDHDDVLNKKIKYSPKSDYYEDDYDNNNNNIPPPDFMNMGFQTGSRKKIVVDPEKLAAVAVKYGNIEIDEGDFKIGQLEDDTEYIDKPSNSATTTSATVTTTTAQTITKSTPSPPSPPPTVTSTTTPSKPANHLGGPKKVNAMYATPTKSITNAPTPPTSKKLFATPLKAPTTPVPQPQVNIVNNTSTTASTPISTPQKVTKPPLKLSTTKQFKPPGRIDTPPTVSTSPKVVTPTKTTVTKSQPTPAVPSKTISAKPIINSFNNNNIGKKRLKDLGKPFSVSPIGLVKQEVLNVNRSNASEFRFENNNDAKELKVAKKNKTVGVLDIFIYLLQQKQATLITQEWLNNHYGWIVWKLAAMERSFPKELGGKYLTLNRVIEQLLQRYQKELIDCKRSILRKLYERDETPERHMILCVSDILENESEQNSNDDEEEQDDQKMKVDKPPPLNNRIELTDGWYAINTVLDAHLTECLHKKKIFIGQKLRIQLSQIVGKEQGISPLEDESDTVHLKIFSNGTRRARWFEKMGMQPEPLFPVSLRSIVSGGGPIGLVKVQLEKIYPLAYKETVQGEDGSKVVVTRTEQEEDQIRRDHQSRMQSIVEQKQTELREKYENGGGSLLNGKTRPRGPMPSGTKDAGVLFSYYQSCIDQEGFFESLDEEQRCLLSDHLEKEKRKQINEMEDELKEHLNSNPGIKNRDVKLVLTIKVKDLLVDQKPDSLQLKTPPIHHHGNSTDQIYNSLPDVPIFTANSDPQDLKKFTTLGKYVVFDPLPLDNAGTCAGDGNAQTEDTKNQLGYYTLLTIVSPSQDLIDTLKESLSFNIYHLNPKFFQYNSQFNQKRDYLAHIQSSNKTQFKLLNGNRNERKISNNNNSNYKSLSQIISNTMKYGTECDLVGLLIYCSPLTKTETATKDGKKLEIQRIVFIVDESGYMAKIQLTRVIWVTGTTMVSDNSSDFTFPYKDGFQMDYYSTANNSKYPMIQLSNLQFRGYNDQLGIIQFNNSKDLLDISTNPKQKSTQELFGQITQWFQKSPGLFSTFSLKVKYILNSLGMTFSQIPTYNSTNNNNNNNDNSQDTVENNNSQSLENVNFDFDIDPNEDLTS